MIGFTAKKIKEFRRIGLSFGLLAFAVAPLSGMASVSQKSPQVFNATENDGTAQDIRPNTAVDTASNSHEENLNDVATAQELARLKSQNQALKQRLKGLETDDVALAPAPMVPAASVTATQATPASTVTVTTPAAAAQAAAAPTPVPSAIAAQATAAPIATPTTTALITAPKSALDARYDEKTAISENAKMELAKQQNAEAKLKNLREKAMAFDNVPDRFIPDLAERLKFTNDILKRFGRAYDYRATTLKDFQKILTELEATQEKTAAVN